MPTASLNNFHMLAVIKFIPEVTAFCPGRLSISTS